MDFSQLEIHPCRGQDDEEEEEDDDNDEGATVRFDLIFNAEMPVLIPRIFPTSILSRHFRKNFEKKKGRTSRNEP